jgi:oligopeptide transport system ATP-binding protein
MVSEESGLVSQSVSEMDELVQVEDLAVHFATTAQMGFHTKKSVVRAVDGVTFQLHRGETLALVGESGSGKSTVGRSILGLVGATHGSVWFQQRDLTKLRGRALRHTRRLVQFIPQDPYASLNPQMRIGTIVGEPLVVHRIGSRRERKERVRSLIETVGLPSYIQQRRPGELSGGERQRVAIARALTLEPQLIICDEPTSALDVSIKAQIIELLMDLQAQRGMAYLFISHDLGMVRTIAHRVAVMYAGKIVEQGDAKSVYQRPLHPYTKALIAAIPIPNPASERQRVRLPISGEPPNPIAFPSGCRFHPRCPFAQSRCSEDEPQPEKVGAHSEVACHYWDEIESQQLKSIVRMES